MHLEVGLNGLSLVLLLEKQVALGFLGAAYRAVERYRARGIRTKHVNSTTSVRLII